MWICAGVGSCERVSIAGAGLGRSGPTDLHLRRMVFFGGHSRHFPESTTGMPRCLITRAAFSSAFRVCPQRWQTNTACEDRLSGCVCPQRAHCCEESGAATLTVSIAALSALHRVKW